MTFEELDNVKREVFSQFKGEKNELIPILQKTQEALGYLPDDAMCEVARFVREPESHVFAVASFYAQFRFTPMGKNRIMVCKGTACHIQGAKRILEEVEDILNIKDGGTTEDLEYTLETAACIGCCALAPCVMINDEVEAKLTPKKMRDLLSKET